MPHKILTYQEHKLALAKKKGESQSLSLGVNKSKVIFLVINFFSSQNCAKISLASSDRKYWGHKIIVF